jgi:hypothetical protein
MNRQMRIEEMRHLDAVRFVREWQGAAIGIECKRPGSLCVPKTSSVLICW